jgi:alkylation response protein AidB-like acyl-CoA dehydrogenase
MMDAYGLDDSDTQLRSKAAEIANDVVAQHAAAADREARFPKESLARLASEGLLGLCIDEPHGGRGRSFAAFAAVTEELAKRCGSTAMIYVMHVTAAQTIAASSRLAERDAILREIAAGRHLTTLALSERGSRSQFWAPVSRLVKSADGYTTNAFKSWVTSAHHADSYVSSAQMPGAASPAESTLYCLPRTREGVRVAGAFYGLGLRGNDSAPVSIEDARIAESELITDHGKGAPAMLEVVLPWFAVGTSAMAHGLCQAAVEATIGHLKATGFEHTKSELRELPNLRARLAEMALATERSRALLGLTLAHLAAPSEVTPLYVLKARLSALETALEVTDLAMKACGGAAFSRHLGIERAFRDARAGWVMAPTADHLWDFIGRALTGLPLF